MAGYGTDPGFTDWLTAMGRELPVGAPSVAALRQTASLYIDGAYGPRFIGTPTDPLTQENEWPRTDAEMFGTDIPSDSIPTRVVTATYEAAWIEANSSGSLSGGGAINPDARVKRSKVDVIEEEYFEPTSKYGQIVQAGYSIYPVIEGILAPLLVPANAFPTVLVV